ncbi:MAG: SGNH/GDSL hydrolase family protein [Ginsengibacter sp.]
MKNMKYAPFLVCLILFTNKTLSQFHLFKDNDRVCFIGNSITMNGRFHNYIELFYVTRFPDRKIKFYNCGISGDVANGILRRMDSDILVHQPTWSVVMVGMNDVNRSLYDKARQVEPGIQKQQQDALNRYFKDLDSIVRILIKAGSKVILQTPSIYDQTADLLSNNAPGVNNALKRCAGYIKKLAARFKLPVVDYWTIMNTVNAGVQKLDKKATIIGADRVHPGIEGHFLMAGEFLKSQHVPASVAYISIDAKNHKIKEALQSNISDIRYNHSSVSFKCRETSLPYPLLSGDFNPDSLFSFTEKFNKEILQIKSLKKGTYILKIDSVVAGTYSERDLNTGINLAKNYLTPQNQQAASVLRFLDQYWELERRLRQIKYVEYGLLGSDIHLYRNLDDNSEKLFTKSLERFKGQPREYIDYYKKNFDEYMTNKKMEKDLQKKSDEKFKEIQLNNKPVIHSFEVEWEQ